MFYLDFMLLVSVALVNQMKKLNKFKQIKSHKPKKIVITKQKISLNINFLVKKVFMNFKLGKIKCFVPL